MDFRDFRAPSGNRYVSLMDFRDFRAPSGNRTHLVIELSRLKRRSEGYNEYWFGHAVYIQLSMVSKLQFITGDTEMNCKIL